MKNKFLTTIILILMLFLSFSHVSAAEWNVGSGETYTNIQDAIDNVNTADGDIINVFSGIYTEDVLVNKNLTIKANNNDKVELKPVKTGFSIIDDLTGNGGGTSISGFIITLIPGGLGVNISANNCRIENNTIKNGENGIITLANYTIIKNNKIYNISNTSIQAGQILAINKSGNITLNTTTANHASIDKNQISGAYTGIGVIGDYSTVTGNKLSHIQYLGIGVVGSYPTISENQITDMVGSGSKVGITVASLSLSGPTGLTLNDNTLFNIRSTDNTTTGMDIFAMSMDSPLDSILVQGNTVSDLYGIGKSTAMSVVALALKGTISILQVTDNTLTNIVSQGENSTSTALKCIPMGFSGNNTTESKELILSNNNIVGVTSTGKNSASEGISFVQILEGNSSISENNVSNVVAEDKAVGITSAGVDYTHFQSNVTISYNIITGISANNEVSGIKSMNLGNTYILFNNLFQLDSEDSIYISTLTPLLGSATIRGNNLEGTGKETGIAVLGNYSTINYNRIVNFQHYIKNMKQVEKPLSDQDIKDYLHTQNQTNLTEEQINGIITAYHVWVDQVNRIPSHTDAPYNWYGTNSDPGSDKFLPGPGAINYSPWLILSVHANPSTIHVGQTSIITVDVYHDSSGGDHSSFADQFFSGPRVTFTTTLGNLGSKSITVEWVNGLATAILRGDESPGIATITAKDYEIVQTTVTILGATIPVNNNAVGMQNTGTPLGNVFMALLLLLGGLVLSKRR